MATRIPIKERLDVGEKKLVDIDGYVTALTKKTPDVENFRQTINVLEALTNRVNALEAQANGASTSARREQEHTSDWVDAVNSLKEQLAELSVRVNLTALALSNLPTAAASGEPRRSNVPEPRAYEGVRDAQALENFLFDMEQYFRASRIVDEEDKVSIALMYFSGDAKSWWRSKYLEIQDGRCFIPDWRDLKCELKVQFLLGNVS